MRLLFFTLILIIFSCGNKSIKQETPFQNSYNLETPSRILKLDHDLIETSGLSTTTNPDNLLTVNDEQGKIYVLNKETGDIKDVLKFDSKDDYEGIEQVGDLVYITNNSGDIFAYNFNKKEEEGKHFKTHLSKKNNIEGLTFDKKNNRLLLACKGEAGDDIKKAKAIYSFDLATQKLDKDPSYVIYDDAIEEYIKKHFEGNFLLKNRAKNFAPSGITIHPKSGKIYALSSRGKMIIVLKQNGKIDEIYFLDDKIYFQPEGICIDQNLRLFISSEGKSKKSRLFEFDYLGK